MVEEVAIETTPGKAEANPCSAVKGARRASLASDSSPPQSSEILASAARLAAQPYQSPRAAAWGVLTAITDKSQKRPQGPHILLHRTEHILGRTVTEASHQFDSPSVSARHCRIFRKKVTFEGSDLNNNEKNSTEQPAVFLKDSSSNGTFINWQRLRRDTPEVQLQHGDIISLVNVPENENAFTFVFREIAAPLQMGPLPQSDAAEAAKSLKRKSAQEEGLGDDLSGEMKRVKSLGISGPDGPVSLNDIRRLQRSNEELRQQLEAHVLTIEKMRAESRASTVRYDNDLKEIKDSISASFLDQIEELKLAVAKREKDLEESMTQCTNKKKSLDDLERQLASSMQTRIDAEEVIKSQKGTIAELKEQLDEERKQRREEREKSEEALKGAVERVRTEASEELKRHAEAAARQHKEHLESINKLQEADKEHRLQVETLRKKMEDLRENLVRAENINGRLKVQLLEEEAVSESLRMKVDEKEAKLLQAREEIEKNMEARDHALEKISFLELDLERTRQDLTLEIQRLQGARERIVLRETQLRAFHSSGEEIVALQMRQQEQLKAMLRTLEDFEDDGGYEHKSDSVQQVTKLQTAMGEMDIALANREKKEGATIDGGDGNDARNRHGNKELNVTGNEWVGGETQEDGDYAMDTCALEENTREHQIILNDLQMNTEQSVGVAFEVGGTQLVDAENSSVFQPRSLLQVERDPVGGETQPLISACEVIKDTEENPVEMLPLQIEGKESWDESGSARGKGRRMNTLDLQASEEPGSWAVNSLASVRGENEYQASDDEDDEREDNEREDNEREDKEGSAGELRRRLSPSSNSWHDQERRALNQMLDIMDPEFSRLHGIARDAAESDTESSPEEDEDEETASDKEMVSSIPASQSPSVSGK